LAVARRRRGFSQLELASLIGRSESWMSKVETGVIRLDSIALAQRIADVLGVTPAHLIGLDVQAGASASPAGGHTRGRQAPALTGTSEWETWDDVRRRRFLTQSAATALLVTDAIGASPADITDHALSALSRGNLDEETVTGLEQVVLGWRQAYRTASAASLLGPTHGTLGLLVELAPGAGARQERVVSLIGQMSALIGTMLMLDLGDFTAARHYLTVSVRAGQQSGSAELTALALACRAFHATYSGDPESGLSFAEASLSAASRGIHPRTHAWLSAVTSEMRAATGDYAGCQRALAEAGELLTRTEPEQPWLGIGAFNHAKLTAYRGGDLSRLGRHTQAQASLRAALAALDPGMRKHRCTAHIDLAESYARSGEVDAAAEHAIRAVDLVASTRHVDSLRRIDRLHARMKHERIPTIRRLTDRLVECKAAW
jgi:transcriptional regulator with XRE-family HTH domain